MVKELLKKIIPGRKESAFCALIQNDILEIEKSKNEMEKAMQELQKLNSILQSIN